MKAWMKTWAALCVAVLAGWPLAAPAQNTHTLPLVRPAGFGGQESLVRIVNRSATSGTVRITAFDDEGERFGPVSLALGARETVTITSRTLESGSAGIGLPVGIGDGSGSWRLEMETALTIDALTYIRTPDRFMTSMHDVAPVVDGSHWVPFFNPGSNTSKVSHLRIVNPGTTAAEVTVTGRDDAGDAASGTVRLTLPAGAARTLTSQQLEAGGAGFDGRLGDGAGKWTLNVRSTADIRVMSLLSTRTGHLANLSTAPSSVGGGAPPPPPPPEPPPPPPPEPPPPPPPEPPPPPPGDDHGNTFDTATVIRVSSASLTPGRIDGPDDSDVFRFELPRAGRLQVYTTGSTDTIGVLFYGPSYVDVDVDDDSGSGTNFRITVPEAQAGTWYVALAGYRDVTGPYVLHVEFESGTPPPPTTRWGAYAGKFRGGSGSNACDWVVRGVRNHETRQSAEAAALADCNRGPLGSGCTWMGSFPQCGAVAYGERRVSGGRRCYLQAGAGGSSGAAEQDAINRCRGAGYTCRLAVGDRRVGLTACNSGYAATNQALSGEAGEVSSIELLIRDPQ